MSKANIAWLLGYLLLLTVAIWAVVAARQWALRELNNDAARAQREEYLDAMRRDQAAGDPVQRRIPQTNERPELMILRDRFWVVIAAAVVFASLFYGFGMYVARGIRRTTLAANNRHSQP